MPPQPQMAETLVLNPDRAVVSPRGLASTRFEGPTRADYVRIYGGRMRSPQDFGLGRDYTKIFDAPLSVTVRSGGEERSFSNVEMVVVDGGQTPSGPVLLQEGPMPAPSAARPAPSGDRRTGTVSRAVSPAILSAARVVAAAGRPRPVVEGSRPTFALRRSRLLRGAPLIGFAEMFDDSRGDEETPGPYPVVVPSAVGPALLPFRCPHCGADCGALVDPDRREHYYDAERKFSWCPSPECRKRFFVDRRGAPLAEALPAGVTVAPSRVERGGESVGNFWDRGVLLDVVQRREIGRFAMLGGWSLRS